MTFAEYLSQPCSCGCGLTATVTYPGLKGYYANYLCVRKIKPDAKPEDCFAMND